MEILKWIKIHLFLFIKREYYFMYLPLVFVYHLSFIYKGNHFEIIILLQFFFTVFAYRELFLMKLSYLPLRFRQYYLSQIPIYLKFIIIIIHSLFSIVMWSLLLSLVIDEMRSFSVILTISSNIFIFMCMGILNNLFKRVKYISFFFILLSEYLLYKINILIYA